MTTYNFSQLEGLWIQAGGPKRLAPLMAAIALAESSGRSDVINSIGACGLWQIHPSQRGCTNPQQNAKMAVAKYHTQGLTAWEAYTNGSYKKFLHGNPPGPTGPPIHTTSSPVGGLLGGILGHLINPDMIQRLGLIVFGAFLIIVGIMMLAGGKTIELLNDSGGGKRATHAGGKEDKTSNAEGIRTEEG